MRIFNVTILAILALLLPASAILAQEKSEVFKACFEATRSCDMDIRISKSDTIDLTPYLNTRAPIYSLSVDATIVQPREGSFTRIVLWLTRPLS